MHTVWWNKYKVAATNICSRMGERKKGKHTTQQKEEKKNEMMATAEQHTHTHTEIKRKHPETSK